MQFAITRVAVPRRANGPDPEPPLGVHEHESSGDRREHPLMPPGVLPLSSLAAAVAVAAPGHAPCGLILRGPLAGENAVVATLPALPTAETRGI